MIFENATIISLDPERRVIKDGAVAVDGKSIAAVGKTDEIRSRFPEKQRRDCNGNILMPGLIDAHLHTSQALLRGCADDVDLIDFLIRRVWVLMGNYTEEDGRASARLALLEMIKSGTTGFIECMLAERYGLDGVADAILKSGVRCALGKIVMDRPSYAGEESVMHPGLVEDGETSIRNTLSAYEQWNGAGDGRLQVWFAPRTPGGVSPELYDRISELARERSMGITIHLCEVKEDLAYAASQGFRSPIEFARAHGLLGPRTVIGHGVWTDEEDWKLLAGTGTSVSHNPASNSHLASGIAPVYRMLEAGVNVAMGCDAATCDNTYDMIRDMRDVSHLAKLREENPLVVPAETVLEMATIRGARAMGIEDETGSIEPGKKADFIIINLDAPHLTPVWDPVSTVVYAAVGGDVDTVVVDGNILMEGRKVLTMDEDAILEEARQRSRDIAKRAKLAIGTRWPVI